MLYFLALLLSYALCFGAINKVGVRHPVKWLRLLGFAGHVGTAKTWAPGIKGAVSAFFDKLFTCPYCMGAWTGGFSWLIVWWATGVKLLTEFGSGDVVGCLVWWCLVSSAFCYIVDALTVYLERVPNE